VVRRFSSAQHVSPPDPATLPFAPDWVQPAAIPGASAGMQRFVWDLRYAALAAPHGRRRSEAGAWAPPGRYTVELSADGHDYRVPLLLKPDPRVNVSVAALQREFELARKVESAQLQVSAALADAVKLLNSLDARLATHSAAHRQMAALFAKATGISGTRPHPERNAFPSIPPLRTDSLEAIAADLDALEAAVDRADADPSPDALSSYATVTRTMAATLAEWTRLEKDDVPKLNERLKAAGEQPI
jgi:hypothetical protein